MNIIGKRTYIVAILMAILSLGALAYTHNLDSLTGLITSGSMIFMRKITGDKNMGITIGSIMALEGDIADAMGKGQTVLVKFAADTDVMAFVNAINKVLADIGKPAIMLKK
jgi:hypothetical protein